LKIITFVSGLPNYNFLSLFSLKAAEDAKQRAEDTSHQIGVRLAQVQAEK